MKCKNSVYDRRNMCKSCRNRLNRIYNRGWRLKNKEKISEYNRKRYQRNKLFFTDVRRRAEIIEGFKRPILCRFCDKEITKLEGSNKDALAVHSLDGNHDNWEPENKVPAHMGCHSKFHVTRYHKKHEGSKLSLERRLKISQALSGSNHPQWKGEKASQNTKNHRAYRKRKRSKIFEELKKQLNP